MPDEPLFAEPSRAESVAGRPKGRDSRPAVERNGPEPTPGTAEVAPARFVKLPWHVLARSDLSPAAKLLYAAIMDRIGENGEAWPGVRRLASDCGLSPATVVAAIRRLETVGLLAVEHVSGNPGGRTNHYRLPERANIRTYQNPNVPDFEHRTYQKTNTERSVSGTEPDPCNQTHVTRPM
jgi:DNA-binding MarR family transcriptional regulator